MTKIDQLIAQAEDERRRARTAPDKAGRDRHVMRAERLLDQAWELNERGTGRLAAAGERALGFEHRAAAPRGLIPRAQQPASMADTV